MRLSFDQQNCVRMVVENLAFAPVNGIGSTWREDLGQDIPRAHVCGLLWRRGMRGVCRRRVGEIKGISRSAGIGAPLTPPRKSPSPC